MAFDMGAYAIDLKEIDKTMLPLAGGKGANLGEMAKINGVHIPEGFCVTTEAYANVTQNSEEIRSLLQLLRPYNRDWIGEVCSKIRAAVERATISKAVLDEIESFLEIYGEDGSYAIRSSAYADDMPEATFAGQHDTYLNITGMDAVIKHIGMCWASFFSEHAVIYRIENGIDLVAASLAVIVQKMVFPGAAGIMFTADPATSNRKIMKIVSGFDQGESIARGFANADQYTIREGVISREKKSLNELPAYAPIAEGGAAKQYDADPSNMRTMTDAQLLRLEKTGRTIEGYLGEPQDIEWLLSDNEIYIAQSRPIAALYPLPEGQNDKGHVYISFGHQSMMTDAIKPLGISFINMAGSNMAPIGGRLYMDLSHDLAAPINRFLLNAAIGSIDPPVKSAVDILLTRKDFIKSLDRGDRSLAAGPGSAVRGQLARALYIFGKNDQSIAENVISLIEANIAELRKKTEESSGEQLFDIIEDEYKKFQKLLYNAKSRAAMNAGSAAMSWVNKKMEKWLGIKFAGDTLARSVENNFTVNIGLDLLDVSDVVRQHPEVTEYMRNARGDTFFDDLENLEGGGAVSESIRAYLEKYGMRCSGEIDITKPRWHETPAALAPLILGGIDAFEPGARGFIFEKGLREAEQMKQDILGRLESMPAGKLKVKKAKKIIDILRNNIGYCEYPQYAMARYCWTIKQALLKEAGGLVHNGVIREIEDAFYLAFDEFKQAVRTNAVDYNLVEKRRTDFFADEKLRPPRVMTSEGEVLNVAYNNINTPKKKSALPGVAVSPGVIEGRALVVPRLEDAGAAAGSIIVTAFADPGWTPALVSAKGLVTEAGGALHSGFNVARAFGFPAVEGVDNAVNLIRDGQTIRVDGIGGYVEIL